MTAEEGLVTFEIIFDEEFRTTSFVWAILRKLLPEKITNQIKFIRQFKDMKGAAFDVPDDQTDRVKDLYEAAITHGSAKGYTLEIARELPELMDSDTRTESRGGYSSGYGNQGGYGNSGGYGRGYNDSPVK